MDRPDGAVECARTEAEALPDVVQEEVAVDFTFECDLCVKSYSLKPKRFIQHCMSEEEQGGTDRAYWAQRPHRPSNGPSHPRSRRSIPIHSQYRVRILVHFRVGDLITRVRGRSSLIEFAGCAYCGGV